FPPASSTAPGSGSPADAAAIAMCPRGPPVAETGPRSAIVAPASVRGAAGWPGRSSAEIGASSTPAPVGQDAVTLHTIAPVPVPLVGESAGKTTCGGPAPGQALRIAGWLHLPPLGGVPSAPAKATSAKSISSAAAQPSRRRS